MKIQKRIPLLLGMLFAATAIEGTQSVKPTGCKGPVLCPTSRLAEREDCCHRWHLDVGLLYQQPAFTGMVSGTTYDPLFGTDSEGEFVNQTVKVLQECLPYSIGLTASLGYYLKHDNWYLGARFDWLSSSMSRDYYFHSSRGEEQIRPNGNLDINIYAGEGVEIDDFIFDQLQYYTKMDIYVLDVLVSRASYMSNCFTFDPYVGVKAVWFDAKQQANYFEMDDTDLSELVDNPTLWTETENNWGAGPMAGFLSEYRFRKSIAFFSDSDVAVLYGVAKTLNNTSIIGQTDLDIETTRSIDLFDNFNCQFYFAARSILGLKFDHLTDDMAHYIAIKLGYDLRVVVSYPNDENGFAMGGLYTNLVWNF